MSIADPEMFKLNVRSTFVRIVSHGADIVLMVACPLLFRLACTTEFASLSITRL